MGDKLEVDLNIVVNQLKENFEFVDDDLYYRVNNEVMDRILCVDFSEIFAYTFYPIEVRKDYNVLEKIFSSKLGVNRDCKMVLTPPAIYELTKYFDTLGHIIETSNYNNIFKLPVVDKYYKAYNNYIDLLDSGDTKKISDAQKDVNLYYKNLLDYGNKFDGNIGSLAFLCGISTEDGVNLLIDEPQKRLMGLIKNKSVISLEKALENPGIIEDLETHTASSITIFNALQQQRIYKFTNNKIDAEMAGLCVGFNKLLAEEKIFMNVFSGSSLPNSVLRSKREELGMDLPRCPLYALVRFYLYERYKEDYIGMKKYTESCRKFFNSYKDINEIIMSTKKLMDEKKHINSISLLEAAYYSMKVLFYEGDLADELIRGSKNARFESKFKDRVEEFIERDYQNEFNTYRTIEEFQIQETAKVKIDPEEAKKAYAEAQGKLQENLELIYISLYEYVKAYDFNKLSLGMYYDYKFMLNRLNNIDKERLEKNRFASR